MASHPFESAREATLSALIAYAEAESRIAALWLQGSLAAGGADPFSDIDAYPAIRATTTTPLGTIARAC